MIERAIILALFLQHVAGLGFAQSGPDTIRDYNLNIVPITAMASRMPVPVGSKSWAPDSLQVSSTPASTPGEVLQGHPSVFIKQYQPGGLATMGLRGTAASHLLNFWNGIPVNSSLLGQSDLGLGFASVLGTPTLMLGGGSLIQGSGGMGGLLDWRSLPDQLGRPPQAEVFAEGGSFGSYRGAGSVSFGKVNEFRSAVGFAQSENNYPYVNIGIPGSPFERLDHAAYQQIAASTSYRHVFFGQHQLAFHSYAHHNDRQLPPTMLSSDAGESQKDLALRGVLEHKGPLLKYYWLHSSLGAVADQLQYQNTLAGIDALSSTLRTQLRVEIRRAYLPNPILRLESAGLRVMRDWARAESIPEGLSSDLVSAHVSVMGGHYREGRGALKWSGLMRQEWLDGKWALPLGFAGLEHIGKSGRGKLHVNLSHNRRWPTLNDRFWTPGGNPDLLPEQSLGAEAGFSFATLAAAPSAVQVRPWDLSFSGTLFSQHVRDWIIWLPGSGAIWSPVNEARVWSKGGEGDVRFHLNTGALHWTINPSASYTLATLVDDSIGPKQLIYTPKEMVKLRTELSYKGWRLNVGVQRSGARFTTRDNLSSLPGFTTLDLLAGKDFQWEKQRLALELVAYNLGGAQYQVVAWRPMPGRSFFVRLNWRWN